MDQSLFIIGVVVLTACIGLLFVAWLSAENHRAAVWMKRLRFGTSQGDAHKVDDPGSLSRSRSSWVFQLLESIGYATKPQKESELTDIRKRLIVAGYRHPKAPIIFWGSRLLMAGVFVLGFVLVPLKGNAAIDLLQLRLLLIVVGAIVGLYLPNLWVRIRTNRRQRQIRDGFPDILDLLVVCVEAGLSLDGAITRVAQEIQESYPAISEEFELLALELRMGIAREEALRNFNGRVDLDEIHQLTTLIIQADRFGGSISRALRVQSDSMRKKRQFRAEELAAKLPVKLTFPLIFFIFPSLFIVLLGPAAIQAVEVMIPALLGAAK